MADPRRANLLLMWLDCLLVGVQFCACQQRDDRTEATKADTRAATGSALFVSIGDQI